MGSVPETGRVARGQIDAQGVADKVDDLRVLGHVGIFAENGAGFGFFHIAFNADDAFAVHLGKERVQQGQRFKIAPFAGPWVGKKVLHALEDEPEGILGLRAKKGSQAAAENDDEFCGLKEDGPFTVGQGVSRKHRSRNDAKTY